jgi:hypothetical protein
MCLAACKKDKTLTRLPQPPQKPTTDFRTAYTGTFQLRNLSSSTLYPETDSGTMQQIGPDSAYRNVTVVISFSPADFIDDYRQLGTKLPALTFTYINGTSSPFYFGNVAVDQIGIDSTGRLYKNPNPKGTDQGGFIGKDSINMSTGDYGVHYNFRHKIWGKRI